jgi:hypothetical protein
MRSAGIFERRGGLFPTLIFDVLIFDVLIFDVLIFDMADMQRFALFVTAKPPIISFRCDAGCVPPRVGWRAAVPL